MAGNISQSIVEDIQASPDARDFIRPQSTVNQSIAALPAAGQSFFKLFFRKNTVFLSHCGK